MNQAVRKQSRRISIDIFYYFQFDRCILFRNFFGFMTINVLSGVNKGLFNNRIEWIKPEKKFFDTPLLMTTNMP